MTQVNKKFNARYLLKPRAAFQNNTLCRIHFFFKNHNWLYLGTLPMFCSEPQSDKERKQFQSWNSIMENFLLPFSSRSNIGYRPQTDPMLPITGKGEWLTQRSAYFKTIWSICGSWSYLFACDEQGSGRVKSLSQSSTQTFHTDVQYFSPISYFSPLGNLGVLDIGG